MYASLLPQIIAIPWLRKVPTATPNNIEEDLFLAEKDKTKIWVLSPSSDKKISIKEIIKVYTNCMKASPMKIFVNKYAKKYIYMNK